MSELSLYLGQVFGLYMIVVGIVVMAKEDQFMPVIGAFLKDKTELMLVAFVEFLAGLFFVLGYQEWGTVYEGVLSVFAWLVLLEGLMYMAAPSSWVAWVAKTFNVKMWYLGGGLASVVIGIYLAGIGFGII